MKTVDDTLAEFDRAISTATVAVSCLKDRIQDGTANNAERAVVAAWNDSWATIQAVLLEMRLEEDIKEQDQ